MNARNIKDITARARRRGAITGVKRDVYNYDQGDPFLPGDKVSFGDDEKIAKRQAEELKMKGPNDIHIQLGNFMHKGFEDVLSGA